jgi:Na+-translocating ferredoxin:NAD+ oxidoreductase RnfD subunit
MPSTHNASREVIMRSAILKSAMVGAALLLASGTARASDILEVNVPFSFLVGSETFPAGHYMVEEDTLGGPAVLLIRGMHTPQAAFVVTHAAAGPGPSKPALQFVRRENQYQLSQVWESPSEGQSVVAHR